MKERPEWLTKSTVHTEEPSAEVAQLGLSAGNRLSQVTASKKSLDTGGRQVILYSGRCSIWNRYS